MIAALAGFLVGSLHVLMGPDHLAAVAPLAVRSGGRAWRTGLRWGAGHAGGVAIVGLLALGLRGLLPLEALSSWGERLVGLAMVGIGWWGFRTALANQIHSHEHTHDGRRHVHVHVHGSTAAHDDARAHRHVHAALGVGTLHGLAGGAHLFGVLPALALPSAGAALAYLVAFGLGTIVTMTGFSALLGGMATRLAAPGARALLYGCSTASVAVGGFWLVW